MLRFRILLAAFAAACVASPVHAQICAPFNDVPASDPFCSNIQWMYNRGVTLGCPAPPGQQWYCPAGFVRRDQMAAFIYRLSHNVVFQNGGNAFGNPAVLGTTDNQPLDIRANNARVVRYEPNAISPNVIGGSPANSVTAGVHGATIGGGGVPFGVTDPPFFDGAPNSVTGGYGTVAGGHSNLSGNVPFATVGGGYRNTASGGFSTVAGGVENTASNNSSTVVGGSNNTASGVNSLAAGTGAQADQAGCFVFANWAGGGSGSCLGANYVARFLLDHGLSVEYLSRRPDGGGTRWVYIGDLIAGQAIATQVGGFLSNAGVWVNGSSSREAKTDFARVDPQVILDKVAALPITTWRYREGEDAVRHIGPMAEDFSAAFDVGYGPHTIADLDARGVALAAIQGLNAKLEAERAAKDAEIAALRAELAGIRSLLVSRASH